jgi:hypothetical protein
MINIRQNVAHNVDSDEIQSAMEFLSLFLQAHYKNVEETQEKKGRHHFPLCHVMFSIFAEISLFSLIRFRHLMHFNFCNLYIFCAQLNE